MVTGFGKIRSHAVELLVRRTMEDVGPAREEGGGGPKLPWVSVELGGMEPHLRGWRMRPCLRRLEGAREGLGCTSTSEPRRGDQSQTAKFS